MFPRYQTDLLVGSAEEAVDVAGQWRASGRFDWFRGQAKPWPLISSLGRLGDDRGEGLDRLGHFLRWLEGTEGLDEVRRGENAGLAVAQHYGLPTDSVDFTTDPDVAAFFAIHGRDQGVDELACLICINSEEYIQRVNLLAEVHGIRGVQALAIQVGDLWRLQAQSGVFLELPYGNVEEFYPTEPPLKASEDFRTSPRCFGQGAWRPVRKIHWLSGRIRRSRSGPSSHVTEVAQFPSGESRVTRIR